MEIELAEERLFLLHDRLSPEEMQQRAMDRRSGAVSSGIGSLLQRPKPDEVVLVGSERRLDPFWHVAGRARYVYERAREYSVPVSSAEVLSVTVGGLTASVIDPTGKGRHVSLTVNEHCVEEPTAELFLSGSTGAPVADGATVITGPREEVEDPGTLSANGTIVVPPEHRSSFVVRTLVTGMMKPLDADSVTEEQIMLEHTDLYYRPVLAFEFYWKPRDRRGVVEVDAITGEVSVGKSLSGRISRLVSRDNLFDVGADAAGLLIPGGSIMVKVAKIAIDQASKPRADPRP